MIRLTSPTDFGSLLDLGLHYHDIRIRLWDLVSAHLFDTQGV